MCGKPCSRSRTPPAAIGPKPPAPPAVALVAQAKQSSPSLGIRLLGDLHGIFADVDALWTDTILERLHKLDEAPWADLRGKPLDARGLANRLRKYEVGPVDVRFGDHVRKGYRREDLGDAWQRYLTVLPESATSATALQTDTPGDQGCSAVADVAHLPEADGQLSVLTDLTDTRGKAGISPAPRTTPPTEEEP